MKIRKTNRHPRGLVKRFRMPALANAWMKAAGFARHIYAERQIYLRSNGQVQFMALSPATQLALGACAFFFLAWVAFTSVNVIFKEQIIAAKDRHFVNMQSAYEERIAQIQSAYEDLNGRYVLAEREFLEAAKILESQHSRLTDLVAFHDGMTAPLKTQQSRLIETHETEETASNSNKVLMNPTDGVGGAFESRTETSDEIDAQQDHSALDQNESGLFGWLPLGMSSDALEAQQRLARLHRNQQGIMNAIEETTDRTVAEMETIIELTGAFEADDLIARLEAETVGRGGPLISVNAADRAAIIDEDAFDKQAFRISRGLDRAAALSYSMARIPLASPLDGHRLTSAYGPRIDPFKKSLAFHSGVDLAAGWRSPVRASGSGKVVFAGRKGAYGKFVEVDHGNGIQTRYGHLSRLKVKVGDTIKFRDVVGLVGSTGRSTGPHLHYEIVVDGKTTDPSKFIEAGRYVFKEQG